MTKRFRMIAGPNGSGKTTLTAWLARDYAVNFYLRLNADDLFAEASRTLSLAAPIPVSAEALARYAAASAYSEDVKARFASGRVQVEDDHVRFAAAEDVNSYTVALVTNFLQSECLANGVSFSQETVFSHPSKIEALAAARAAGYRTYLYYVATPSPSVNVRRVSNRASQGGHAVPETKIRERYGRSLANVRRALPYLSRAFFFDNGGSGMSYLADYSAESGMSFHGDCAAFPAWFRELGDLK